MPTKILIDHTLWIIQIIPIACETAYAELFKLRLAGASGKDWLWFLRNANRIQWDTQVIWCFRGDNDMSEIKDMYLKAYYGK